MIRKVDDETGLVISDVKPYVLDLESTNGTFLNKEKIESARYYELKHKDVLKFALSTRDYVVMREG